MKHLEAPVGTASDMASRITYSGSGVSLVAAGIGGIDWVAWLSAAVAVAGLCVNLFFKLREDRRKAEIHELEKQQKKQQICKVKGNCNEQ